MTTLYEISAIEHIVHWLRDQVPPDQLADTPLPVIAAPGAWMDEVRAEFGALEGDVLAEIYHCPVLREDSLDEPFMVTHDGRVYRVRAAIPQLGVETTPQLDRVIARLRASADENAG